MKSKNMFIYKVLYESIIVRKAYFCLGRMSTLSMIIGLKRIEILYGGYSKVIIMEKFDYQKTIMYL